MDAGVIPVKSLRDAKSRLAGRFDEGTRIDLARALLRDALELAVATPSLEWFVVTSDEEAAASAGDAGLEVIDEDGRGLNEALETAARVANERAAGSLTVVPCDVPLATPYDLGDLLDTGATSDVVVVPAGNDGGTNGLYLSPPNLIQPRFGPSSLDAHIALAEKQGFRCTILALPRLALDIDTPEDVDRFLAHPRALETHTGRFLQG